MRWLPHPDKPDYEISETGLVRYVPTDTTLQSFPDASGYHCVNLNRRRYRVHRMVCLLFNGAAPPGKTIVRHIDGDRSNNTATNLVWGSHSDNVNDWHAHRKVREVANLTRDDGINQIKHLASAIETIAAVYGISKSKLKELLRAQSQG